MTLKTISHCLISGVLMTGLLIGAGGCSKKRISPASRPQSQSQTQSQSQSQSQTTEDFQQTDGIVDILLAEARNFYSQEDYSAALNTLNQALTQADEDQVSEILMDCEKALSKLSFQEIQYYLETPSVVIPKPLLLYWAGVNASFEGDYASADMAFDSFLNRFPDHPPQSAGAKALIHSKAFPVSSEYHRLPAAAQREIFILRPAGSEWY